MMDTLRVLWFFLWRMSLLGLALGAMLGAVYGFMLMVVASAVSMLAAGNSHYQGGAEFVVVIGAFYGGIFIGAPAGLVLGILDGFFLGALMHVMYRQSIDLHKYRRTAGWACAAMSLAAFLALSWIFANPDGAFFDEELVDLLFLAVVPALIASFALWWAGRKVAVWYAREASGSDS